jgi:hypothetical protein
MKTSRQSQRSRAVRAPAERTKQNYQAALRACEAAAARVKAAGDELAAGWTALCQETGKGVSATDLLRKRAWCNVLELRLKEEAYALEEARHGVDALWEQMVISVRARELFTRFIKPQAGETYTASDNLPLLARTASALAEAQARTAPAKKQ